MKRYLLPVALLALFFSVSCKKETKSVTTPAVAINNQLEEKAGGVMTPEILWKFNRLGSVALSPNGSELLYTVTGIDAQTEARLTNICRIPSSGGDPVRMTPEGGSSQKTMTIQT